MLVTEHLTLESVTGLSALHDVGGDVIITGNEPLTDVEAESRVVAIGSIGGTVRVSGNGSP